MIKLVITSLNYYSKKFSIISGFLINNMILLLTQAVNSELALVGSSRRIMKSPKKI